MLVPTTVIGHLCTTKSAPLKIQRIDSSLVLAIFACPFVSLVAYRDMRNENGEGFAPLLIYRGIRSLWVYTVG
jgi:hypothetical protein